MFQSWIRICLLAVAAFPTTAPYAAVPSLQWEKLFGGNEIAGTDRSSAVDSKGDIFVGGTDFYREDGLGCMFVAKFSAAGEQRWAKALCDSTPRGWGQALAVDPLDNVIVTGLTDPYTPQAVARTVKLSNDGAILWDARLPVGETSNAGVDITTDRSGNVFVLIREFAPLQYVVRYTRDGAFSWKSQATRLRRATIAAHPGGDLFVAGTVVDGDDLNWSMTRLRADNGTLLNGYSEMREGSFLNSIAVDSKGNVIATGSRNNPGKAIMKTVKHRESDLVRAWARELEADGNAEGWSVAVDSSDDVVVTGTDGRYKTLKYRSTDGATLWEASYAGRGGVDVAQAVSIDSAGDVTVTGYINLADAASVERTDIRTIKYSGRDGSQVWSVGYDSASGLSADAGVAVHDIPNGVYVVGTTSDLGLRVAKYGNQVLPVESRQGLWWNSPPGSESGWGLNIAHQGDKLFVTWFTYDLQGNPTWYVMPNTQNVQGNRYEGSAYRMGGPPFSSVPFDSARVAPISETQAILTFTDTTHGRFFFRDGDRFVSKEIVRLDFFSPVPDCRLGASVAGNANFQDLWWASPPGSESGWGLNVAHQGDVIFATWFTYDAAGKATWFVGSDVRRQADGSYFGSLEQTTGPAYNASPWDPTRVRHNGVGSMTLTFSDYEHGAFAYTVNGISQSKPITRLLFSADPTRCH